MAHAPQDAPTDPDQLIRFGTIASVDGDGGRCTVLLDTGALTPPIRWFERAAGNTSTRCEPSDGEQAVVLCPGGEFGAAIALCGVTSSAHPLPGAPGTNHLALPDGATFVYDPATHRYAITLPSGGILALAGDLQVSGNVQATGTIHAAGKITSDDDVLAAGISGKGHRHGGVKGGADTSGAPQ